MTKKRCFVISPIGAPDSDIRKHADAVFRGIIMPAMEELKAHGLEIESFRSDHLQEPGKISDQMFREIFQDDFCIAILTSSLIPMPSMSLLWRSARIAQWSRCCRREQSYRSTLGTCGPCPTTSQTRCG
jgi:hypothetical protein